MARVLDGWGARRSGLSNGGYRASERPLGRFTHDTFRTISRAKGSFENRHSALSRDCLNNVSWRAPLQDSFQPSALGTDNLTPAGSRPQAEVPALSHVARFLPPTELHPNTDQPR